MRVSEGVTAFFTFVKLVASFCPSSSYRSLEARKALVSSLAALKLRGQDGAGDVFQGRGAIISWPEIARRLERSDVDLFHLHHRIERALGGSGIGTEYRFGQSDRRDLQDNPHLSLHQPHSLSSPPLPTIAFQ